jgi:L-ascorbate metabolism protein UlaG (beta-lactamase superfamily)
MLKKVLWGIEERVPPHKLPVEFLSRDQFRSASAGLEAIWLGHSTVLLEIEGRRLLTDPVWAERCSPSSAIGPKRFHPVPLPIAELPPIDAVVISHDHYDHLDMEAVQSLNRQGVKFIVPLGVGAHLEKWGVSPKQFTELDWWEVDSTTVPGLQIICTPARHFSGRGGLYGNQTLWSSFAILGEEHRVYFSGDSGPFPGFAEIGARCGPFDLTMMKIGAYATDWPDVHINPRQAVEAHKVLQGKRLLPVHWGTFNLAYHDWDEPIEWLLKLAEEESLEVIAPQPGERVDVMGEYDAAAWWRE